MPLVDFLSIDQPDFSTAIAMTAVGGETAVDVVVVEIADGDSRGRGECVPVRRKGETIDSVLAAIQAMKGAVFSGLNRDTLQQAMPPGAARNAIDCAFWAIDANRAYRSVADMAGLGSVKPVVTALTLGFDTPDKMAEVAAAHRTRALFNWNWGAMAMWNACGRCGKRRRRRA